MLWVVFLKQNLRTINNIFRLISHFKQPIKKNYISLSRPEIMFSYMRVFTSCILIPKEYFKKSRDALMQFGEMF